MSKDIFRNYVHVCFACWNLPLRYNKYDITSFHIGDENPRKEERYRKAALSEHDGAGFDVEARETRDQEEGRSGAVV